MESHLELLFADSNAGQFINMRAIPGDRDVHPVLEKFFDVGDIDGAVGFALSVRETHNVYVGVAARNIPSGGGDAVGPIGAIWVDCDSGESATALGEIGIEPSILVASGTGENRHAYFLLEEKIDPARIEGLNLRLIDMVGGDRMCRDRARIMRLAGTLNHKSDPPEEAELIAAPGKRYALAEIEEVLRSAPTPTGDAGSGPAVADEVSPAVKLVLEKLDAKKRGGKQWQACCPAHDDKNPSLSIAEAEDGRCLIHCFAGCSYEQVLKAIGLTPGDLAGSPSKNGAVKARLMDSVEGRAPELFSSSGSEGWISFVSDGKRNTFRVLSREAERWLQRIFFEDYREAIRTEALREVQGVLEARALFDGDEHETPVRVAGSPWGPIYLDLGDSEGHAVQLEGGNTSLVTTPPVYFRRSATQPLPIPNFDGAIEELRPFANVRDEAAWMRLVGFLLMSFHPAGPYPVLSIMGEQGSAKSTLSRLILSLVDPHPAGLLAGNAKLDDLALAASESWLIVLDNVSKINPNLSDALCRISTGGGLRRRQLYTDRDEVAIEFRRPIVINGIGSVIKSPDLLERTVPVNLIPISQESRRTEADLEEAWREARPRVLGALLNAVSEILDSQESIVLQGYPRMADFARWGEAAAGHFGWEPGAFSGAIEAGQDEQVELSIDDHPEIRGLIDLMSDLPEIQQSAAELLQRIHEFLDLDQSMKPGLIKQPAELSRLLSVYAPALRKHGIEVKTGRKNGGKRKRYIHILKIDGDAGTDRDGPHELPGLEL